MNLQQSLKSQFFIQKIFGLSVLNLKNFRADKRTIVIAIIYILIAAIICVGAIVRLIPGIIEVYADNPIDQSSYSSTIGQTPICFSVVLMFVMWISVTRKHEYETQFYQKIENIDKDLLKYLDLQKMYKKFRWNSRFSLFPFLFDLPFAMFSAISYSQDGLFVFANIMVISNVVSHFNTMYVNIFYLNVKLIRDRLKQVQTLCESCDGIEKFRAITEIYKNLTILVQILTKTCGSITGMIFINNFFSIACYSYMLAVSVMLWSEQRSDTLLNIVSVVFPNMVMMFEGFSAGHMLINDVSPFIPDCKNRS